MNNNQKNHETRNIILLLVAIALLLLVCIKMITIPDIEIDSSNDKTEISNDISDNNEFPEENITIEEIENEENTVDTDSIVIENVAENIDAPENIEISANAEESENIENSESISIFEKKEASYEHWLAAGMIVAMSMQFSEFEISEIRLTGETDLADKENSEGCYIVFTSNGNDLILCSKPLNEERNDVGTIDLYTADLGFATFDIIDNGLENTENYKQIALDELSELISQSLLVSVYEH